MGPFFGGIPPVVAPEGTLVFGKKAELPLTLFKERIYTCTTNWGVGCAKQKNLEILYKSKSDVAVGYSKHW
jgi:hypothetical protein